MFPVIPREDDEHILLRLGDRQSTVAELLNDVH
jgi:hypothetical protein